MLQSQKIKLAIYALILAILAVALSFWAYFAAGQKRDYERISDLKVWQSVLARHYFDFGTYRINGCETGMTLAQCLGAVSGKAKINAKEDPINAGVFRYVVGSLDDSDFEIKFSLESGVAGLKPGQYVWTKNGLKK